MAGGWYGFPRPVVAAVNGHAIAGGMVLALCADHRVGSTRGALRADGGRRRRSPTRSPRPRWCGRSSRPAAARRAVLDAQLVGVAGRARARLLRRARAARRRARRARSRSPPPAPPFRGGRSRSPRSSFVARPSTPSSRDAPNDPLLGEWTALTARARVTGVQAVTFQGVGEVRVDDVPEPELERGRRRDRAHRGVGDLRLGPAHLPRPPPRRAGLHDRPRVRRPGGREPATRSSQVAEGDRVIGCFVTACGQCFFCRQRRVPQVRRREDLRPREDLGRPPGRAGRAGAGARTRT